SSVFFFQAEDGIRDGHVTGVQTCALPISSPTLAMRPQLVALPLFAVAMWALASRETAPRRLYLIPVLAAICANVHGSFTIFPLRSEERRVGKECGSGWVREQETGKELRHM